MKQLFLLTTLALLYLTQLPAQIVTTEEVKEKTEDKVDQRVDRKVDEGIDKTLDGFEKLLFGKKKNKKKDKDKDDDAGADQSTQEQGYNPSNLFGGGDAEIADQYTFDTQTDVQITTANKNGKKQDVNNYQMLFPNEGQYFGMDMSQSTESPVFAIFDFENGQMINLTESNGNKMAMVIKIDQDAVNEQVEEKMEEQDEDISFRKTGRTKKIHGYSCDEYEMESEDGHGTFWITDDTDLHIGMAMGSMAAQGRGQKGGLQMPEDIPQGAILEMHHVDKDGSTMDWETTDIKTNIKKSISTEGYQVMSLGGMGGGK